LLESADALVLGRVTYEAFAASWPGRTGELADRINYPFIAGSGEPLLPGITTTYLDLAEVNEVGDGVVVLTYKPKR
jgi:hypothetical protein